METAGPVRLSGAAETDACSCPTEMIRTLVAGGREARLGYAGAALMRLFIAVDLDDAVRTAAASLLDELRRRATRLAPRARVTWVAPERLHVTIRFIGEVDDTRVESVERALAPSLDLTPFEVRLAGTGVFPVSGPPRVIWVGSVDDGRLGTLHRAVSERLVHAGLPPEDRPFSPHLTLGRVREAAGLRGARLLEGLTDFEIGRVRVTHAVLVESRLSPRGPDYAIRLAMALGG
jgi:2'-5' RNA ligase